MYVFIDGLTGYWLIARKCDRGNMRLLGVDDAGVEHIVFHTMSTNSPTLSNWIETRRARGAILYHNQPIVCIAQTWSGEW